MNPIPCPHCDACDAHGSHPVNNPKRNDPFRTDEMPCELCNGTGEVDPADVPTHGRLGFRAKGPMVVTFTEDSHAAQLAAMPHHKQAVILSIPHGSEARELAANFAEVTR